MGGAKGHAARILPPFGVYSWPRRQKQAFFLGSYSYPLSAISIQVLPRLAFGSADGRPGTSQWWEGEPWCRLHDCTKDVPLIVTRAGCWTAGAAPRLVLQDSLAPRKHARGSCTGWTAHRAPAFHPSVVQYEYRDMVSQRMPRPRRWWKHERREPRARCPETDVINTSTRARMCVGARRGFSGVLRCGQP